MYTIFVYVVFVTFQKHGVDEEAATLGKFGAFRLRRERPRTVAVNANDVEVADSNSASTNNTPVKESNQSVKQPPQQSNKNSLFDATEIRQLLDGSIIKNINRDEIPITRPQTVGVDAEEGLRDARSAADVVASVLSSAEFGDRLYETESKLEEKAAGKEWPVLTAYVEPINQTDWQTKPLPKRSSPQLFEVKYPHVNSCSALTTQWPIDTPPTDLDPFLPWIHDVFPSPDGQNVVFVAQNRRRCFNGQRNVRGNEELPEPIVEHKGYVHIDPGKNYFMRPQAALFQHVPVKQINGVESGEEPRYRLASHEDADPEGMETRFICRFKQFNIETSTTSIVGYSLSQFELDYDYHTFRKGYLRTHSEAGYDNHVIWTSQLLFKCPIPPQLHRMVMNGDTVTDDYSTLFVDLVPIRTPPRYTPPREFLPPRYNFKAKLEGLFVPDIEWGKEHILPKIDDSGRIENIPICMPSLMQHSVTPRGMDLKLLELPSTEIPDKRKTVRIPMKEGGIKIHTVIACTWASATFKTRGNRASVGDGKRRLKEWLEFNLLAGFDHIYVVRCRWHHYLALLSCVLQRHCFYNSV